MNAKKILKRVVSTVAIIALTVAFAPSISPRSLADDTTTATTFHAIVYKAGSGAAVVDSDTTYTIASKGILTVDKENDGVNEIVADSTDYMKLAKLVNDTNIAYKSSYTNLITNKEKTDTIYGYLGYGTKTTKTTGISAVSDMVSSTSAIKTSLGY